MAHAISIRQANSTRGVRRAEYSYSSSILRIPGKPFTFRTLAQAQAAGDIQALQAHEQQAIVLPLGKNPIATIRMLTKFLASRVPARRLAKRRTRSVRARKR